MSSSPVDVVRDGWIIFEPDTDFDHRTLFAYVWHLVALYILIDGPHPQTTTEREK